MNGEAVETTQGQLSASYGPVTATDCLLALPGASDLECGALQKLIVQPKNLQHGMPCTCCARAQRSHVWLPCKHRKYTGFISDSTDLPCPGFVLHSVLLGSQESHFPMIL